MISIRSRSRIRGLPLATLSVSLIAALGSSATAQARTTFSFDPHSASFGTSDCSGAFNMRAADILQTDRADGRPALHAPSPMCVRLRGGAGAGTLGLVMPLVTDVDALSYGTDARLLPNTPDGSVWFSVSRSSIGVPLPSPYIPNVNTEAACGDQGASVFVDGGVPSLPTTWMAGLGRHVEAIDGNGYTSCSGHAAPGLGLIEPEGAPSGIDADDLDALDVDEPEDIVYFSLDGTLMDPCAGVSGNGSAAANGYAPAAILVSNLSGAAPNVWATPASLGLDLDGGFGSDDLDALAIWDNGNGTFDHPEQLLGWLNGGGDMVLFSVRTGSAVIGMPDSLTGSPIEAGDVLVPPIGGGMTPFPAILIPAEALGLATMRSGLGWVCGASSVADDLDGLDTTDTPQFDCDGNGREDALDIVFGSATDANKNGVPDSCEPRKKIRQANAPSGSFHRSLDQP